MSTLEQIHEEVEKLRDSRWRWRVFCALLVCCLIGSMRSARHEYRCAQVYRAIAYELAMSMSHIPQGEEDTNDALQLLAQTDAHN